MLDRCNRHFKIKAITQTTTNLQQKNSGVSILFGSFDGKEKVKASNTQAIMLFPIIKTSTIFNTGRLKMSHSNQGLGHFHSCGLFFLGT